MKLSGIQFALLFAAALSVSMAYGVTLPLLPVLIEQSLPGSAVDVARHTGWLTSAYTVALFAFSPAWGIVSDRLDRRVVMAIGLVGSGIALWGLDRATTLASLYIARVAAGALSAAVLPAVLAYAVEASIPGGRQRRFAWIASATALGFLLGPVVGDALRGMAGAGAGNGAMNAKLAMPDSPFVLVALVCLVSATLAFALPRSERQTARAESGVPAPGRASLRLSLLLTALVVFGITIAEVGLTLLSRDSPFVNQRQVAGYFALCSGVMVGVQMWAYPWLERWLGEHRLVAVSFAGLGAGLVLLAWPIATWTLAVAFTLIASGVGVLIPALGVRVSVAADTQQGWALGWQAAVANLGQATGAAVTGVLYVVAAPAPFVVAAATLGVGGLLAAYRTGCGRSTA